MKFKTKLISAFAAAAMLASFGAAVYAEGENVAAVNGTDYQTLQAAINAAAENAEIDLTADTKEDITIVTGQNVTIDLNGHKITNDKEHTITNKGTLTVKDDSEAKTGTVDSVVDGKAAVYNESGATATLESGTYERSEEAGTEDGPNGNSHYTINNQGTMKINNAVVNNNGGHSSNIINGGFKKGAELTIEGATVTGGVIAVKNDECFQRMNLPIALWCKIQV